MLKFFQKKKIFFHLGRMLSDKKYLIILRDQKED